TWFFTVSIVDGVFTDWSNWTPCSATCMGISWRSRKCIGPFYGGQNCLGSLNETVPCNSQDCAVDGVWDPWSEWMTCASTCGNGVQTRSRYCIPPHHGGKSCEGDGEERRPCKSQECPGQSHHFKT
ncbi:unnamed protein product, partial [Lymnaea stagnalis]